MPAQPPTAPCEVCGATTTTNCSSCAQVGIDLFFCSRDCQKLVWCSHKFVCGTGGRAGPIKIPELSAEEIEDLKARADNSMWLEIGGFSSVKADLERFSGRSFEYVLKHLPGPTWSTAELPLKPLLVAAVRSSRLAVCRMNLPPSVSPPVPFFFLAAQQCQVYVHLYKSEMLPPFVSYKSWNDFLIHRLLVLAIRTSSPITSGTTLKELQRSLQGCTGATSSGCSTEWARATRNWQTRSRTFPSTSSWIRRSS
ncbi:RHTO0S21e01112g1_1 [Rhodotorula toruloides]|uniref:RHTO0S21e01112g1_1 n=1 Tax=Rhodotorula toruloides TaxID=5286 RepID=A0A061BFX4_RHOTO|nr:RHTO0S21e01112g1_1 [Rhodotorula toruloides]